MMEAIKKLIHGLTVVTFALLVIVVFLQVVCRIIGIAMPWSEEAARFLFIWLIYLAGFITIRKGMNITFDLVLDLLPKPIWKVVFTIVNLVSIVFLVVVIVLGTQIAWMNMTQLSTVLRIPMGWIYLAIPIGSLGMLIAQIEFYFKHIRKRSEVVRSEGIC